MIKKLSGFLAAAVLTLSIAASAFAAELINADKARAIAEQYVPAGTTYLVTHNELYKPNPFYEVKFYNNATNTEYEVKVFQNGGAIKEYQMEAKALTGSSKVALSTADIQALVTKEFPDAVFHKIELDRDNNLYEYEVKFSAPGLRGEMVFNPETGAVMEKEIKYAFK